MCIVEYLDQNDDHSVIFMVIYIHESYVGVRLTFTTTCNSGA
jgi:hypothetical protein